MVKAPAGGTQRTFAHGPLEDLSRFLLAVLDYEPARRFRQHAHTKEQEKRRQAEQLKDLNREVRTMQTEIDDKLSRTDFVDAVPHASAKFNGTSFGGNSFAYTSEAAVAGGAHAQATSKAIFKWLFSGQTYDQLYQESVRNQMKDGDFAGTWYTVEWDRKVFEV